MGKEDKALREQTLSSDNIRKEGGRYRFVNHDGRLVAGDYDTLEDLAFGACRITFDPVSVLLMRAKYLELFGAHRSIVQPHSSLKSITGYGVQGIEWQSFVRFGQDNPDIVSAPAPTSLGQERERERERERLNIQYWTETVPMVADYNKEHGTDIKPWSCVLHGNFSITSHPYFDGDIKPWRIAVAIVYDEATGTHKPVHVGDPIWIKGNPHPVNWALFNTWKSHVRHLSKDWTWTPPAPKREFEINGEKFTCPEKKTSSGQYILRINGTEFGFRRLEERDHVQRTITKLLIDASNK